MSSFDISIVLCWWREIVKCYEGICGVPIEPVRFLRDSHCLDFLHLVSVVTTQKKHISRTQWWIDEYYIPVVYDGHSSKSPLTLKSMHADLRMKKVIRRDGRMKSYNLTMQKVVAFVVAVHHHEDQIAAYLVKNVPLGSCRDH